jgi:NAD(P)-dependent dehydrogenase (short-subunit alcohol dehydrogenase family)
MGSFMYKRPYEIYRIRAGWTRSRSSPRTQDSTPFIIIIIISSSIFLEESTANMAKIWFITGSSRGLGLALVKRVLEAGDSVVATARKAKDLEQVVSIYGADRLLALDLDVTNASQVDAVVQKAKDTFGRIDVVVNNAGYADTSSVEDTPLDAFRAQIDTNYYGVVYVTKAVLPIMREQGSGHILQVSSLGGRMGTPGLGAYQSAKWAVNGFSTVLAAEVAPLGIKVTSLEPGGIKTDWAGASMSDHPMSDAYQQTVGAFRQFRDQLVSGWTPPERIAAAIYHISQVPDPPVRLLLGPDTVEYARQASEGLAASDAKWQHVTKLEF